jgi:hypothetical protein
MSRKRVCCFSNWQLQENVINRASLFGGEIFMFPPFNPPNPVSSKHTAAESGETNDDDAIVSSNWGQNCNNPTVDGR